MPSTPTPRSYNSILADMIDAFLSRYGIRGMYTGSPVLAMMESAAQSDLRSSQDIFDLLRSQSLELATGVALDRLGLDENRARLTESASSGTVTIGDSSFTKVSTKVYGGKPPPITGATTVYVADASGFDASGEVYLGRGTNNYEGPLAYSAKTDLGSYWSLTLSTGTTRFHDQGESVIMAQGGDRAVTAGETVQTAQGNVQDAIRFSLLFDAVLPDGETEVTGVQVQAQKPGLDSNVTAGGITEFVTPPFSGATVTNPLPFINGQAAEDDETYREVIRNLRQSRVKGTELACTTALQGVTAADENKRITSVSFVSHADEPATLYIDDGTGYEEVSEGVPLETLMDAAVGGEKYFQLANRPVTKAQMETLNSAPYVLAAASRLAVKVGGVVSEHSFDDDEFRNIGAATAYEVVASINGNSTLTWSAATTGAATGVRVFAKTDSNEDLEVVDPTDPSVENADDVLQLTGGRRDTLRLYLNDRLLSKDGQTASLTSNPISGWGVLTDGETLILSVDGTTAVTYTFNDIDFVNAGTGYTTVGANTTAAWAAVLDARIPGTGSAVENGLLVLRSNLQNSSRSALSITGGTLVTKGVFGIDSSEGADRDYTMDRNTAQIRLESVLSEGDGLTAGSLNTRGFLETEELGTVVLAADAELYFVADGGAEVVLTGLTAGSDLAVATVDPTPDTTWGERVAYTAASGTPFENVEAGDWVIIKGANFTASNRGYWRVALAADDSVTVERLTLATPEASVLLDAGTDIVVVRTPAQLQKVTVAAGTWTAASLADELNTQLIAATAETYRTNKVRVHTNRMDTGGDIALVATNAAGLDLLFSIETRANSIPHLPSVSSRTDVGTPTFAQNSISAVTDSDSFAPNESLATGGGDEGHLVVFSRDFGDPDGGGPLSRWGSNQGLVSAIYSMGPGAVNLQTPSPTGLLEQDRFRVQNPYSFGPQNDLVVLLDNDLNHRYNVPLYRRLTPAIGTYGAANEYVDADNSGATLASAFGQSFDFKDWALYMPARVKTHSADATKRLLWRNKRLGPDGETTRVKYVYPESESLALAYSMDTDSGVNNDIAIALPSGALRTGYSIYNGVRFGLQSDASGSGHVLSYVVGFAVSSATREHRIEYSGATGTPFSGTLTDAFTGNTATIVSDSNPGGAAGYLVVNTISGPFTVGGTLTSTGGKTANADTDTYGWVTLTLTLPSTGGGALADITDCGLSTDAYYLNSGDVNFTSGSKSMSYIDATHVGYTEAGIDTTAASIGTISAGSGGTEANFTGASIVEGDLFTMGTSPAVDSDFHKTIRIGYLGDQVVQGYCWDFGGIPSGLNWSVSGIGTTSLLKIYPLASNTASDVETAVNALGDICPVGATVVGTGDGSISLSSDDEAPGADTWFTLADGQNWIQSAVLPALPADNYEFTFKKAITADLSTDSDWDNEDVRLVPLTAKTVSDWLAAEAVSGLGASAEVLTVDGSRRLQIASLTTGSEGSVQVQGGTANAMATAVVGSGRSVTGSYTVITVPAATAQRFRANSWVSLDNSESSTKSVFTALTALTSIDTEGVFTLSAGPLWTYSNSAPILSNVWRVEKHGDFVAYSHSIDVYGALTLVADGVQEGDWVRIYPPSSGSPAINSLNEGVFRVVRAYDNANEVVFWVENPNATEEDAVYANVAFFTPDSLMSGDTVQVNSNIWGAGNIGSWTVQYVGGSTEGTQFASQYVFKVDVSGGVTTTEGVVAALGTDSNQLLALMAEPCRLIKKISSIFPNQDDPTYLNIKLESDLLEVQLNEVLGTVATPLDLLGFDTDAVAGQDGYRKTTGLIGEANRVIYGDPQNPATYPGVAAAGSRINISGPLVKRAQVSLQIRVRYGSVSDIKDRVRSAVASIINRSAVGEAVAISDIVSAAMTVNGVVAVSVLSPIYSVVNDRITVQASEKLLVLDLDQDISITIVGE
jgi:hypothetical protein